MEAIDSCSDPWRKQQSNWTQKCVIYLNVRLITHSKLCSKRLLQEQKTSFQNSLNLISFFCFLIPSGLISRLQQKLAPHGVKLSIPGVEGEADISPPELTEPGLVRLLSLLCGLELNGNLQSELQQMVEKEKACLLQDTLLRGLLDSPALRHCLDTSLENSTPGKIKIIEVRGKINLERN